MAKQELYKTCKYQGEYVAILRAFYNGDTFGTWRYTIKKPNGEVESQVDESELSGFCL
jgi:hypothetical protein